jgi:plasmid stabilization system protein ParE
MERVIVWNRRPSKFLRQALKRISEDSTLQSERVEEKILTSILGLILNPERYPPDKFKKNNPGNFRAFEIVSFRIAYKFTTSKIVILRIRHVKQEPKEY